MKERFFVDIAHRSVNYGRERICGDSFLVRQLDGGMRTIAILSDGLGHGVKANVLSSLTSSMLMNFVNAREDIQKVSAMSLKTLPVCSVRKISYSTFTFMDIDHRSGKVVIVEYDNPRVIVMRGGQKLELERCGEVVESGEGEGFEGCTSDGRRENGVTRERRRQTIYTTHAVLEEGDRMVLMSDGIVQSGQGAGYAFGWGERSVEARLAELLEAEQEYGAEELSYRILSEAIKNDGMKPHDDMTCAVVWLRKPRRMVLASCPPSSREHYRELANRVGRFDGRKVVCGYPVAEIIAAELGTEVIRDDQVADPDVPPAWRIKGLDLVTEGIVTLNKVCDILEHHVLSTEGVGPAYELYDLLMKNDYIEILIGTKRYIRSTVYVPDEFALRRKLLRRMASVLEKRYMKRVNIIYI